MTGRSRVRGFTLIELMVVVCIVGLLSSVAFPLYQRATLRTRAAERGTMLQSMKTGIENAFFIEKIVPPHDGTPDRLNGAPNPAGLANTGKRHFVNNLGDWAKISVVVQGDCYYTYAFQAWESAGNAPAYYELSAVGDLDGDGIQPFKRYEAERVDGRWRLNIVPVDGEEDDVRFGSF